jgi:hypothetical protein
MASCDKLVKVESSFDQGIFAASQYFVSLVVLHSKFPRNEGEGVCDYYKRYLDEYYEETVEEVFMKNSLQGHLQWSRTNYLQLEESLLKIKEDNPESWNGSLEAVLEGIISGRSRSAEALEMSETYELRVRGVE